MCQNFLIISFDIQILRLMLNQGNLKGESVVVAILPSHMEGVIVPPDFFVVKPAKQFR